MTQTKEEELVEHDKFLLGLLSDAPNFKLFKLDISTRDPAPDIRFVLFNEDESKGISVGVSIITTTFPFGFGKPVLYFFCFYNFKKSTDTFSREYLYGSELYVKKSKGFRHYRNTWWDRLVKFTNDFGKITTSPVRYMPEPGTNPVAIEKALKNCVMGLIKNYCTEELENFLRKNKINHEKLLSKRLTFIT